MTQRVEGGGARHVVGVVDARQNGLHLLTERGDETTERVTRDAQLVDLQMQCLSLDGQIVEHGLARFARLFDHGPTLFSCTVHECLAVHLARVDETLRREARVVVDLVRGVLGLGDDLRGSFLGFDQVGRTALLALGEELGTAFLGFGGDARGLFVRHAQYRRALGSERARQGRLVEGRIRGAALGLGELGLQFVDPGLHVGHFTGHGLEVQPYFLGVDSTLSNGREVDSGYLGRRLARGGEDSAFVHSLKTTAWHTPRMSYRGVVRAIGVSPPRACRSRSAWPSVLTPITRSPDWAAARATGSSTFGTKKIWAPA